MVKGVGEVYTLVEGYKLYDAQVRRAKTV
jgi:hypothetical protein